MKNMTENIRENMKVDSYSYGLNRPRDTCTYQDPYRSLFRGLLGTCTYLVLFRGLFGMCTYNIYPLMVIYVNERSTCMIRKLKLVELTETYRMYPDLVSSPPNLCSQK